VSDEIKTGAYICKGCGLGERLDCGQLATIAEREGKANLVREHDFLCNAQGVAMIQNDIDNEGVNKIVIAACSRRSKSEAFNFENVAISRSNLREGVIWTRPDTDEARETTQEMAADYVRMGCSEVKFMQLPQGNEETSSNNHLLVVGGGIVGMTAAIEAAAAGYPVTLVEKSGQLGGGAVFEYKRIPEHMPYDELEDNGVAEMVAKIEGDSKITVHLNSTLTKTSGAPGRFSADISTESGSTSTENFGAIIMASGARNYDANQLPELGYGKTPDVIDQTGLEKLAMEANGGPIKRPSDGKVVENVVFVQCAGQRSTKEGHLPYCSGHCCLTSIKQAMYFKDQNPQIDTNIIYTDLRTPGAGGEDFYRSGQQKGITFTKGTVSEVTVGANGPEVKFNDLILDQDVNEQADLVVLATGQIPNSGVDIDLPVTADVEDIDLDNLVPEVKVESILNLTYRQGPDLPHLKYGFNDSHFICMAQAKEDATGAALKAIQALENAKLGRAAHPRSGDLSFPSFRKEGCTQCKRCTVECPFGAIDEDEERYPQFNEARCRRCGTCMGACPVRVISFENYSVDSVGQQLKNIEIPDEFEEKPRILVLACENDAYPALDMAAQNGNHYSPFARVIPVRCLGSVNTIWVTDALNSGYDGIVLMGCQKGENYQCHFVKGSEIAHVRMSKIDDTLESLSLEKERVATYEVAITDIERAPQLINDMAETVEKVGMSPFKF
jgi:quinone-modifying oxidoreductase subunit QmoB